MHNILNITRHKFSTLFIWFVLGLVCSSISVVAQEDVKKELQRKIKILKDRPNYKRDTAYINLLYKLGSEYNDFVLDSSLIVSNETIKLSEAINYIKGESNGYIIKGNYYSDIGEQDQAISCFSMAHLKAQEINDLRLVLQSKSRLATEYMHKGEFAKSLKTYLRGIELAKEIKDDSWLSTYYINISVLYSLQKEYDQTIFFLKKAMELNKKVQNQKIAGITLSNLAFTYIEMGDLESASIDIDEAISIFKELKLDFWLTYAYETKATIYFKKDEFNNAITWLEKSEDIHKRIDQTRYKIPLYLLFAQVYFELDKYKLAEDYGVKALDLSEELNDLENRDEILKILYKIKKEEENYTSALGYLEELKAISDTLNKNNNKKELRLLKSNLEFEQEKEQYILDTKRKYDKQRNYIVLSVIIILAFLVIIIILKTNNKMQNVLNQKLLENTKALEKNEIRLNEANNTKNKLFSIIAHDLKGPVNSFKGLFDLFNKSQLTHSDFMEFMPQMSSNIDSIAFTLNNLLTWGQTQMDGLVTQPSFTNIKVLVDENIALLSKQAELKSIETINTIPEDLMSWCDKNQMDIVIRNLISNAVKFTREAGTITISASQKSNFWVIAVKDNGVGISKEGLVNIFKDDDTSTSYGTKNEKGTGLGLRVCKEMVKNNGGCIWAESEPNQGATFYFTVRKTKNL